MAWSLGLVQLGIQCLAPFTVPFPAADITWLNSTYDGSRFVIMGSALGTTTWTGTSTDGSSWNWESEVITSIGGVLASNGSRILTATSAGTQTFMTSDDNGNTWDSRIMPFSFSHDPLFNGPAMYMASNGSGFINVGRGTITASNVYHSINGTTWAGLHVVAGVNVSFTAAGYMNGAYYIAGVRSGVLYLRKSTNGGSVWTTVPAPTPALSVSQFPFMWTLNNKLVLMTRQVDDFIPVRLWSSTNDGSSWTEHTLPFGLNQIVRLGWDGSRWIAASNTEKIYVGSTLDNLLLFSSVYTALPGLFAVSTDPGNFIAEINGPDEFWVIDLDCD